MTQPPARLVRLFAVALTAASLAACGGGDDDNDTEPSPAPTPAPSPAPGPAPSPSPSPAPSPVPGPGQPADALAGRWVPLACGDVNMGGSDTRHRGYHIYTKTSANTLQMSTNVFDYSASNCGGNRTTRVPQNTPLGTLTMGNVETAGGYIVHRVVYAPQALPGVPVPSPYQNAYVFTPRGTVCISTMSSELSTAELVEDARNLDTDDSANCGHLERN